MIRYNANGSVDTTLEPAAQPRFSWDQSLTLGNALVSEPGGSLIVVGDRYDVTSGSQDWDSVVAKFSANGILDTTFGTSGYRIVSQDATYGDGFIDVANHNGGFVMAGRVHDSSGSLDYVVSRVLSDGTIDSSFGTLAPGDWILTVAQTILRTPLRCRAMEEY